MRQSCFMATETQTLTFLGGAGTVTGSKYLLTINDRRILVDGGMFLQGAPSLNPHAERPLASIIADAAKQAAAASAAN